MMGLIVHCLAPCLAIYESKCKVGVLPSTRVENSGLAALYIHFVQL